MISTGFAPVIADNARVLILGSFPGQRSLRDRQYYAHPQNAFWRLMAKLLPVDPASAYPERCNNLKNNGIALWDVLSSSSRPGSLDSAIELGGARNNDFGSLLDENKRIQLICFNGRKARELFDRLVVEDLPATSDYELVTLPSSSAAFAAMSFEGKLRQWSVIARVLQQANSE